MILTYCSECKSQRNQTPLCNRRSLRYSRPRQNSKKDSMPTLNWIGKEAVVTDD